MRFLTLSLKRILSLALVLMIQVPTQTLSGSLINTSVNGSLLSVPVITYTVSASVPGGFGTAISVPETVDAGQDAIITLTPDIGYHIHSVLDNDVDVTAMVVNGVYSIMDISENHTVVAAFAINNYTVAVSVNGGNGTAISVPETVDAGQNAIITMTPDIGYHIETVTDNDVDVTAQALTGFYSLLGVSDNHTVIVTYAINHYALSVSVETTMMGLVNGEATLSQSVTHGTEVTLSAQPALGFIFSHWIINEVAAGNTNPLTLTMDGPKTVVAVFVEEPNLVLAKQLVTFFEENTVLGTLTGVAKTDQAQQGKLKAFDNKLKAVVNALKVGDVEEALGLLNSTAKKIDGELNPPDFVSGDQSDELYALMQALITSLSPVIPD